MAKGMLPTKKMDPGTKDFSGSTAHNPPGSKGYATAPIDSSGPAGGAGITEGPDLKPEATGGK